MEAGKHKAIKEELKEELQQQLNREIKEELGREPKSEELIEIDNIFNKVSDITDLQVEVVIYKKQMEKREQDGFKIINLKEQATEKELIQLLQGVLTAQENIDKQVSRIKIDLENNKYTGEAGIEALKGIVKREKLISSISKSRIEILTHFLNHAEIEDIGDIRNWVSLSNILGLLWAKDKAYPTIEQIKNFERAYRIYKENLIKNDLVFIERTPTVKTGNIIHLPTGKFKSLDYMVNSGDTFHSETITKQAKNKGMIIKDEKILNLRIEKIDNNIKLDFFDDIVYISVCEIYRAGNDKISIDDIYKFMAGGRVSKDMALLIDRSMKRLSGIRIEAEDTDQVIKIGGALINFKGVQTNPKKPGAKITNVYYIQEEPFYLEYEKNIGRFRPIYKEWVNIRHTKQIIELEWALAWEIASRINMAGANKEILKINIDNLLERIGIVNTGDKKRDSKYRDRYIENIENFLEQHTYLGNIYSYSEYPERPIEYIEKEVKTNKPIKTKAYLKGYNITIILNNETKQIK